MATRTKKLQRRKDGEDWCDAHDEPWICDSHLRGLFAIPRKTRVIFLCASEKPQPGTVEVAQSEFNIANVNGEVIGLYPNLWYWLFKDAPVSVWYCWVEYDPDDERN